ncbi:MAG: hypothetical protein AAGA60_32290 [Cyanobacteria bacterium P01_E01_bin.42]
MSRRRNIRSAIAFSPCLRDRQTAKTSIGIAIRRGFKTPVSYEKSSRRGLINSKFKIINSNKEAIAIIPHESPIEKLAIAEIWGRKNAKIE